VAKSHKVNEKLWKVHMTLVSVHVTLIEVHVSLCDTCNTQDDIPSCAILVCKRLPPKV
jgi:hypothetical protein